MSFVWVVVVLSQAAGAAPRAVSLAEALSIADAQEPSVIAARARAEGAVLQAQVPGGLWLPRVGLAAELLVGTANNTTASVIGGTGIDTPRIGGTRVGDVSGDPYASSLAGVGLHQEIFDFGRIGAQTAVLSALARVEQERADAARLDVHLAVREAFFAVRAAREVVLASREAKARAAEHREQSAAGVAHGLRAPIELTRVEADLSRAEVGVLRAEGALDAARALLAAVCGAKETQLDASDEALEAAPVPDLDQAQHDAAARSPALREGQAQLEAQAARTHSLTTELFPNLQLSATVSGRAGGAPPASGTLPSTGGWLPTVPNYDAAVVLAWPFLDFAVLRERRASSRLEDARRAELEATRQQVGAQVQQLWQAAQVALATLPALERAFVAAKANEGQAEARFKGGLGNAVELSDAEALRVDAEIALALGRFDVLRSRARLARALAEDDR